MNGLINDLRSELQIYMEENKGLREELELYKSRLKAEKEKRIKLQYKISQIQPWGESLDQRAAFRKLCRVVFDLAPEELEPADLADAESFFYGGTQWRGGGCQ